MKTAVSIPDDVYETAEKLAQRLGTSRSQLYARALSSYLQKHDHKAITAKLNEVYAGVDSALDIGLAKLQRRSIQKGKW